MKFITLETLQYFKTKLEGLFVKKENKTGSTTEYKVLSDNNLTDELVQKINEAGSATAVTENIATAKTEAITESKTYTDGVKDSLTSDISGVSDRVTAIEGSMATDTELSEAVAAAKTELNTAITTATNDMATQTWTTEQITTATTDMATNASVDTKIAEAKTYADTAEADAIASAKTYTDEQVSAAKTELTTTINTKIATAYKVKGSTVFASLPALSEAEEGNVYNITEDFTSTADFVEGADKKYTAGTNIVCIEESEGVFKWDVLAGFIDTDVFVKTADIETVTTEEIDALFA